MLVFGDNMRGKTSLLNAIRWALYGKTMDRLSREIPIYDLVNSEAKRLGRLFTFGEATFRGRRRRIRAISLC